MPKIRVGNKQNSYLNGEYAGHVRGKMKKLTSKIRRNESKLIKGEAINDIAPEKLDVDFIKSRPLTKKESIALSAYIKKQTEANKVKSALSSKKKK